MSQKYKHIIFFYTIRPFGAKNYQNFNIKVLFDPDLLKNVNFVGNKYVTWHNILVIL